MKRTPGSRKLAYAIAIVLLAVILSGSFYARIVLPFSERASGNSAITVFGRIVDENGSAISGATVSYRITYSDHSARPGMYGRGEKFKSVTTTTDPNGDYRLSNVYGYF